MAEVTLGRARVRTQRGASCEQCGAQHACSCLGGGREALLWVEDPLGVRVGDRVTIAVPEGTVLRASVLAYLLPVAALVVGALVGHRLASAWGVAADLGAAGLGLAGMAAAFLLARYLGAKAVVAPRIVRKA